MKKYFTLIETIVVLGILGFFIPLIFNIIFTISREQIKVNRLSLIKKEGDYVVNNISNLIKNYALYIYSSDPPDDSNIVCNQEGVFSSLDKIVFKDKNNDWFKIFLNDNKISSYSSSINKTFDLNSNKVKIYNFSIGCENNFNYSSSIVDLGFDICYKGNNSDCVNNNLEQFSNLRYQTKIKLRNY